MLGILLTILKIIGIILLVLIGLILLAAAVILLVPIRYHGEGAREEKILSGNVKLTWLLHMISASASLSEDGTKIRACLFGKTIYLKSKAKKMPKQEAPKKSEKSENPPPPKPPPKTCLKMSFKSTSLASKPAPPEAPSKAA